MGLEVSVGKSQENERQVPYLPAFRPRTNHLILSLSFFTWKIELMFSPPEVG